MSDRRTILVQLDSDRRPSVFDRIVALDAGADVVLSHGAVEIEEVRDFVHGAIFTRGPKHLHRTAIFIGGSDIEQGERMLAEVRRHLLPRFGLSVSILMDVRGANTTAAAAVSVVSKHFTLKDCKVVVLGTGPVGRRVLRLLARAGADLRAGFVHRSQAEVAMAAIQAAVPQARIDAIETENEENLLKALQGHDVLIAAGPTGKRLLLQKQWQSAALKVVIDLNAVPPAGLEGIEPTDNAKDRNGVLCYGPLAVGDVKMKIHKAAIARLFERNDHVLDAEELLALA